MVRKLSEQADQSRSHRVCLKLQMRPQMRQRSLFIRMRGSGGQLCQPMAHGLEALMIGRIARTKKRT